MLKHLRSLATVTTVLTIAAIAAGASAASACAVAGGSGDPVVATGTNSAGWGYAPTAARQIGIINTAGAPLVDLRCVAPWNISAVGTDYAACNQSQVLQDRINPASFIG